MPIERWDCERRARFVERIIVREKRFGTIEMTDAMKSDLRYTLVSKTMLADDYFSVDIYELSDVSRCGRCMLSSGSWTYLCFDDGLAVGLKMFVYVVQSLAISRL